jgi:type III pantothenate kinase
MDINLLVLNVGNSRLGLGTFIAGELAHVWHVPHAQRADWPAAVAEAWSHIAGKGGAAVAGASVNPPLLEPLEHVVHQATGVEVQWVGRQIQIPIKILTEAPNETGIDRVLNVAAAYEQMQKACVVVDAGSAITVDCCNDAGEFLGGSISPGAAMMLDALHERTASLPRVEFDKPASAAFGKSTKQAILQGVYHGIRGMVKELVENYATALGSWPEVIATGGDAKRLFEGWELIHAVSPDLTLYGVALAYVEDRIKREE